MIIDSVNQHESTLRDKNAALDKISFGQRYGVSKRTVDAWLAGGCPHLKLSSRTVRIPIIEASQWVKEHFLTQRRKVIN